MSLDETELIFKLVTSPSLISLIFPSNFRFQEQLKTLVMDLDGIDTIFKLAILDELDDARNLNQSICVWSKPQGFSKIILDVGPIICIAI